MISRLRKRTARVIVPTAVIFVVLMGVLTVLATMAGEVMTSWGKAYASADMERLPKVDVAMRDVLVQRACRARRSIATPREFSP